MRLFHDSVRRINVAFRRRSSWLTSAAWLCRDLTLSKANANSSSPTPSKVAWQSHHDWRSRAAARSVEATRRSQAQVRRVDATAHAPSQSADRSS
ncbi:hypothetical protein MTO96_039479 [Rhipicephalus appendiculatus]